jgi:hypothetical protein
LLKKARQALILCAVGSAFALFLGCGSYNGGSTSTTPATQPTATKRAFLLNEFGGVIDVINSATDMPTGNTLSAGGAPTSIIVMSNKKSIVHSSTGEIVLIDDATESVVGTVNSFPGATESIVPSKDGLFAYAAIPSLGEIAKMDLTTQAVTAIPAAAGLPGVRHLAITHNGNTILAFSDNTEQVARIDRTQSDKVTNPFVTLPTGSRPYTALFSSDDTTAYILNCGVECGGTVPASIVVVNISDLTNPVITANKSVRAATVAVMDNANIYVAGTDVTTNLGRLDVMNLSSLAVTPVATPISDGLHTTMALAANNKLYIGSKACTNSGGSCLSVYNTSSGTAAIVSGNAANPAIGDVTAITPIVGRPVVYIIQGGTLTIYDSSTDTPQAGQIFISGKVSDVKEVDN